MNESRNVTVLNVFVIAKRVFVSSIIVVFIGATCSSPKIKGAGRAFHGKGTYEKYFSREGYHTQKEDGRASETNSRGRVKVLTFGSRESRPPLKSRLAEHVCISGK